MIAETTPAWDTTPWQRQLAEAIREPAELLERLNLPPRLYAGARAAAGDFPLRVPESYLSRIEPGNPRDPLLLQVLPAAAELRASMGFGPDPVGDMGAMARPGVLHKYEGRVLLTLTGACPVHCRYCFRRHFPYAEANPSANQWREAIAYIEADPGISEVILSGGDPLLLVDAKLSALVRKLERIAHIRRLRIHTRTPVVLPSRVDAALCSWLSATALPVVMVLHANHPAEIDAEVAEALCRLRATGTTLLNQSVLLRDINDSANTLAALSEALFQVGVLPYYLHALDRVQGGQHFAVDDARAVSLLSVLRARLPGYLVPRLVREIAGAPHKEPLTRAVGTDTFSG